MSITCVQLFVTSRTVRFFASIPARILEWVSFSFSWRSALQESNPGLPPWPRFFYLSLQGSHYLPVSSNSLYIYIYFLLDIPRLSQMVKRVYYSAGDSLIQIEDLLENGLATTHSCTIPWEEAWWAMVHGSQNMVRHKWVGNIFTFKETSFWTVCMVNILKFKITSKSKKMQGINLGCVCSVMSFSMTYEP